MNTAADGDVPLPLLNRFQEENEVNDLIVEMQSICDDELALEANAEKFVVIFDKYQEQPHLLDPFLEQLVGKLIALARDPQSAPGLVHQSFKFLYIITKVRGHKSIVRLFPHEVVHLEPILRLAESQDPSDVSRWEIRYVSLVWLSILVMAPFDMKRFDSDSTETSVTNRIIALCKKYVQMSDKSQDAAALLFAKFVSRPDISSQYLGHALKWLCELLEGSSNESMVCRQGALSTMAMIFKHGQRKNLEDHGAFVLKILVGSGTLQANGILLRKLSVKLVQRIGAVFLKTRIASWRYQRGTRSLTQSLPADGHTVATSSSVVAVGNSEDEEEYDVPEIVEEILEHIFLALKDKDTIVRWSAAKGIGRITGRLPRDLADDIISTLLTCFTLQETDGSWHGGCLALAELGRRGLLLPSRLKEVIPVVVRALGYDYRKGLFSIGAAVRDAACYVCWSFARAYDPQEFLPYVQQIAVALVITAVFDREINCRRAASAAFQENVGRQGVFPHGIEIVTIADFFAVGNRSDAYLKLSVEIGRFPEYTHPLIDHLTTVKTCHWDSALRVLSSQALHKFTLLDPDYIVDQIYSQLLKRSLDIDVNAQHGGLLSLGEVTHALSLVAKTRQLSLEDVLGKEKLSQLRDVVPKFNEMNSLKGPNGEMLRFAVCSLIEKLSLAFVPFYDLSIIGVWQSVIDENIPYISYEDPWIQNAALEALKALAVAYYSTETNAEMHSQLIEKYLERLHSPLEFDRMGFALGLGKLPKTMFTSKFDCVLNGLVEASRFSGDRKIDSRYAEARRDAIRALGNLCVTVGLRSPEPCLSRDQVETVFSTLLSSLEDYTRDERADVGAWVREAGIETLEKFSNLVARSEIAWISSDITSRIFCSLVQHMNEGIDKIRLLSGKMFVRLLHQDNPAIPHIKHQDKLKEIFPLSDAETLTWFTRPYCFERTVQLLSFPEYRFNCLLGFIASVGGLTKSLVQYSSSALLKYLNDNDESEKGNILSTLVQIFQKFLKVERVSVPMFKLIDLLLANCRLENLAQRESELVLLDLCILCKTEIARTRNMKKIIDSISVFCGFLQFSGKTRSTSLERLLILLCHTYPRVRKEVADQLYVTLQTFDDIVPMDVLDEALGLLTETSWMSADVEFKSARNRLCDLFGVPRPKPIIAKPKGDDATDQPSSNDAAKKLGYQDLVDRVGY